MVVGQVLLIEGLKSRPELNGNLAVVIEVGEKWRCQLVATGERIRIRPSHTAAFEQHLSEASSADAASVQTSRPSRKRLKSSDFGSLQEAIDAAPAEGAVLHVDGDYGEIVRISKPISLIGMGTSSRLDSSESVEKQESVENQENQESVEKQESVEEQRRRLAGVEVDIANSSSDLVELRNLQLGCKGSWLRGSGLRIYDGSPVVVNCTIGGMVAVRVDSFKKRSCPVLMQNLLEGRLGGIWWDGACWEGVASDEGRPAVPLSPAVRLDSHGMPNFVLDTADANKFSGDLRWICCSDTGVLAVLTDNKTIPLEAPGPEDKQRRAMAEEIKGCSWYVHRPTLALMDRTELLEERAAWALLASEPENAVRLEVQAKKMFSHAEQIRHWRSHGQLIPEDLSDLLPAPSTGAAENKCQPSDAKEDTESANCNAADAPHYDTDSDA